MALLTSSNSTLDCVSNHAAVLNYFYFLAICIRASHDEKLQFLFSLFDVDIDGYIT